MSLSVKGSNKMAKRKQLLFSTSSYQPLQAAMLKASKRLAAGKLARSVDSSGLQSEEEVPFPDGERYHALLQDVEDRDVVLLGGTINAEETLELLDLGNLIVDNAANKLKIVIPYFGWSTQERAVNPGEAAKAKYRARMISNIPRAANGNQVFLMDLHSEGIPHYFEGGLVARHIYAKPLVIEAAKKLAVISSGKSVDEDLVSQLTDLKVRIQPCHSPNLSEKGSLEVPFDDFCLASTDTGRAKWVESLTRDMVKLGLPVHPAFIIKRRIAGDVTQVMDISADVEGKVVILYDDMIRTGGSLIKAAEAYLEKGALCVAAISTHAVLPGDALKRLEDSGKFVQIVVTDSHPRANELASDFLRVISCAKLLADNLVTGKKR